MRPRTGSRSAGILALGPETEIAATARPGETELVTAAGEGGADEEGGDANPPQPAVRVGPDKTFRLERRQQTMGRGRRQAGRLGKLGQRHAVAALRQMAQQGQRPGQRPDLTCGFRLAVTHSRHPSPFPQTVKTVSTKRYYRNRGTGKGQPGLWRNIFRGFGGFRSPADRINRYREICGRRLNGFFTTTVLWKEHSKP